MKNSFSKLHSENTALSLQNQKKAEGGVYLLLCGVFANGAGGIISL